ncbi:hypothetical protein LPUS_03662 [Lasallia pustulata]|uniref:Uncharacterized protein n=1 Tax=Lasallia pustulata TaxID=136370 RepID=A0A1W5CV76_9LECA|nr:hypothetical protein LPUS_03662 [Lasallia pustulata]
MVFGREPLTWVVKGARKRIEINCHNWKSRSLSKMKEHVKNYIKLDTTGMLAGLTDDGSLITFFASKYSASNFVWVFEFVREKINIEQSASKSPHAAYYFRNIYANLAARTKLHLDWESDHFRRVEDLNSREAILGMFDLMAISGNYADLEPEDFQPPSWLVAAHNINIKSPTRAITIATTIITIAIANIFAMSVFTAVNIPPLSDFSSAAAAGNGGDPPPPNKPVGLRAQCDEEGTESESTGEFVVVDTIARKRKGNRVGKQPVRRSKRARHPPLDDASDGENSCPEWCRGNNNLPARMQQARRRGRAIWAQPNPTPKLIGRPPIIPTPTPSPLQPPSPSPPPSILSVPSPFRELLITMSFTAINVPPVLNFTAAAAGNGGDPPPTKKPIGLRAQCNEEGSGSESVGDFVVVDTSGKRRGNGVGAPPRRRSKRAQRLLTEDASNSGDACPEWCRNDELLPAHAQQARRRGRVIWAQPNHTLSGGSRCGAYVRAGVDECFVVQASACAHYTSLRNPRGQCQAEPPAIAAPDSGSPGVVVLPAHDARGMGTRPEELVAAMASCRRHENIKFNERRHIEEMGLEALLDGKDGSGTAGEE